VKSLFLYLKMGQATNTTAEILLLLCAVHAVSPHRPPHTAVAIANKTPVIIEILRGNLGIASKLAPGFYI